MLVPDIRIASSAFTPAIERQEPGFAVLQPRGHGGVVFVQGEVDKRSAPERQKRLAYGRAVITVLFFRVAEGRSGQKILRLDGGDGRPLTKSTTSMRPP